MWKGTLALLTCMQLTGCATPFEKMWQGLATCELDTLHLDIETGRPANPQLAMYTPDKVSEGFAWSPVAARPQQSQALHHRLHPRRV